MKFNFYSPVKIIFGEKVTTALPVALTEAVGGGEQKRALIVSDEGVAQLGIVDDITRVLEGAGWKTAVFTGVQSNPTTGNVSDGVEAAKAIDAEALVAVGGGSPIDVAKGIGLLLSHGGTYADYQWNGVPITKPITPLIAVPTTSGTGSEVTRVAVVADEDAPFKKGVLSDYMLPKAAIIDPQLTVSVPPRLTAATGADVLAHALEAFVGKRANPVTDALAASALMYVWKTLPRAFADGADYEAREWMALASTIAGLAFDQSGLGIIHSLAGPLAETYHLHHGECIAMLLSYGLAYNLPVLGPKRAQLLDIFGLSDSLSDEEVVGAVKTWIKDLGLPVILGDLNIVDPDFQKLAEDAARMVLLPNNPRPATAADCQTLFELMV
jgi:alcohol dehydrogenase